MVISLLKINNFEDNTKSVYLSNKPFFSCLFFCRFNIIWFLSRFNFVASTSELHLLKMEFLELKYRLLSLLVLAESKLKSWIIKYGRRESVELLLQNYMVSF